jgi:ubiquinone/menaquinone biosynthesis C-methylase UbiE
MGMYRERVLPKIQNRVMNTAVTRKVRARVCEDLRGDVVEIGFGTGLNIEHYPATVSKVLAVEPSSVCMRIAQPRIEQSSVPVDLAGLDGARLDLPTDGFDAVLSTWTLCTIPDVDAAVGEIRRVLKPGGRFHFVEHGHSADANVAKWQRRVEPLSKRVFGGCHVTRDIRTIIETGGFSVERIDTYYIEKDPKVFGYTYEGFATKR